MKSRVEFAAERLQLLAVRGEPVSALVEHAVSALCGEVTPFNFIATLRLAFDVPVGQLRDIEGWVGWEPREATYRP